MRHQSESRHTTCRTLLGLLLGPAPTYSSLLWLTEPQASKCLYTAIYWCSYVTFMLCVGTLIWKHWVNLTAFMADYDGVFLHLCVIGRTSGHQGPPVVRGPCNEEQCCGAIKKFNIFHYFWHDQCMLKEDLHYYSHINMCYLLSLSLNLFISASQG